VLACDLSQPPLGGPGISTDSSASSAKRLLGPRVGPAGERLRPGRRRIDGHERFGEDRELRALACSLGRARGELLDRGVARSKTTGSSCAHATVKGSRMPRLWLAPALDAQDGLHPELAMVRDRAPEPVAPRQQRDLDRPVRARLVAGTR
jgi:hypothetical protein